MIKCYSTVDPEFAVQLKALLAFDANDDQAIEDTVSQILSRVRREGDAAVLELTQRFDRVDAKSVAALEMSREDLSVAFASVPGAQREALETAAKRITAYHQHQLAQSWSFVEADGTRLGQKVTPLDRVGLYVPGGKAAYPSSVLMNALPAKVAGVGELVMVVPTPNGERNSLVLAAACLAGVDRVFGRDSIPIEPGGCRTRRDHSTVRLLSGDSVRLRDRAGRGRHDRGARRRRD